MKAIVLAIALFVCSAIHCLGAGNLSLKLPRKLSPTLEIVRQELSAADSLPGISSVKVESKSRHSVGLDGFTLSRNGNELSISSDTDLGALYATYRVLSMASAGRDLPETLSESPAYSLRLLNHWDNLDGTVERGYAGKSLWRWDELPDTISPRYAEYARRNARVGINGAVLNNVNASPRILSTAYLHKAKAIADVLRPYGVRCYLSVNFASPMALDSLPNADPLNPEVQDWWKRKADEIYRLIPDFGGFLVKANSEGQPGPMDFGRTHAEGANMLARAIGEKRGVVMWRAFVYSPIDADRAKQAYMEFKPLDGKFAPNVIVQVKNGPIDFQPREAYSPLFGAMPGTPEMAEFQITQEYLGHANHFAFLAPMWEEFFAHVAPSSLKAIAGVANVGDCGNMTGHPLADANWYAFGRLAWDPSLDSRAIAGEWIDANLINRHVTPDSTRERLLDMFTSSRETVVDYMMPLGLHHIFAFGHHYGPEPWCDVPGARPDWLPRYYHQADSAGIGFDRSPSGSNAVGQYPEPLRSLYGSLQSCPDELLLWFHHVPWNHRLHSGRTLWQELCHRYARGVKQAGELQAAWNESRPHLTCSDEMWTDVSQRLVTQSRDAQWWKDACLLYFSGISGLPLTPEAYPVTHTLTDLTNVNLGIDNYTSPSPGLLDSKR